MVTKTPKTPCGSTEKCPAFPVVKKKKKVNHVTVSGYENQNQRVKKLCL